MVELMGVDAAAIDKTLGAQIHQAALYRITGVIAECADLTADGFQAVLITQHNRIGQVGVISSPGFPIDQLFALAIFCVQGVLDRFHQLLIQQAHQIKAEAVNMVFLHPIQAGIENVLTHHAALGSHIIAAAGSIGQAAVGFLAIIVTGHGPLQPGVIHIGMVVYHFHDHPEASACRYWIISFSSRTRTSPW